MPTTTTLQGSHSTSCFKDAINKCPIIFWCFNGIFWFACLVGGVILILRGNAKISEIEASGWENANKQTCVLTHYESQECQLSCGQDVYDSDCGAIIIMYATIANNTNHYCDYNNNITLIEDNTFECDYYVNQVANINDYNYQIGNEYDCWIKNCDDNLFSLSNPHNLKSDAILLLTLGIVAVVLSLIPCLIYCKVGPKLF